jgi:hypothetical protein
MPSKNKTLVVMATNRQKDVMLDQIDAIHWTCQYPHEIIVVDDKGGLELPCKVMLSQGKVKKHSTVGFKVNEAIKWALNNIDFEMVMVLDDDALPIGKGLDSWALNIFKNNPKIGTIGVEDSIPASNLYNSQNYVEKMLNQLSQWVPIENWTPPKQYVFYAVNFQSRALVEKLNTLGLLDHDKDIWPAPCETFQSWVTTLAGFELYLHGQYPHNMQSPLYAMYKKPQLPDDPRTLNNKFLLHHSIKDVAGVDEWTIRNHYKKKRTPKILMF